MWLDFNTALTTSNMKAHVSLNKRPWQHGCTWCVSQRNCCKKVMLGSAARQSRDQRHLVSWIITVKLWSCCLPGSVISVYTNWVILLKQIAFGCSTQPLCLHPGRHKGLNREITHWITAQCVYNITLLSRQSAAGRISEKSVPKALPHSLHSTCTFEKPTNNIFITVGARKLCAVSFWRSGCSPFAPFHSQSAHSLSRELKSQSFRRSRILWHLRNNLADSCYAFIHQCIHLTAHEYKCDGWPVISDLSPLWVILPLRLMQCFLMHIHQSNEKIRSGNSRGEHCHCIKETAFFLLLEFTPQCLVFKWEFRRWADCWERVAVLWHHLPV